MIIEKGIIKTTISFEKIWDTVGVFPLSDIRKAINEHWEKYHEPPKKIIVMVPEMRLFGVEMEFKSVKENNG